MGSFAEFRITPRYHSTGYLTKVSSSNYVLNVKASNELRPIRVKHILINYYGRERSNLNYTTLGDRGDCYTWAEPGYSYALNMARENWWDGPLNITGSWSPDN